MHTTAPRFLCGSLCTVFRPRPHFSHTHPHLLPQIPVTTTEEELQGLFAPYGSIVELALLKKNPSAGVCVHTRRVHAYCPHLAFTPAACHTWHGMYMEGYCVCVLKSSSPLPPLRGLCALQPVRL